MILNLMWEGRGESEKLKETAALERGLQGRARC